MSQHHHCKSWHLMEKTTRSLWKKSIDKLDDICGSTDEITIPKNETRICNRSTSTKRETSHH
eukprot:12910878-Prorocentrum_lima.AAC.1